MNKITKGQFDEIIEAFGPNSSAYECGLDYDDHKNDPTGFIETNLTVEEIILDRLGASDAEITSHLGDIRARLSRAGF